MLRGDIVRVDFAPALGSEADKVRPAIIVSNDGANRRAMELGRGVVTVVPLTSNVDSVYRFQVRVPAGGTGLPHPSKAQAEQIRAVSVERIREHIGRTTHHLLSQVEDAIRLHLALDTDS